jgi:flagellar hook assembly protein FlgD
LNDLGARLWGQADIAITSFATIDSDITSDSNGGLIFSLAKFYDFIISAQQISVNGNLGEIMTSINKDKSKFISRQFQLFQNYPNPFNPTTVVKFHLSYPGEVELKIYNLLGQQIEKLISEKLLPGEYRVEWDGKDDAGYSVSSGIYYYRLKVDDRSKTRKMLMIK